MWLLRQLKLNAAVVQVEYRASEFQVKLPKQFHQRFLTVRVFDTRGDIFRLKCCGNVLKHCFVGYCNVKLDITLLMYGDKHCNAPYSGRYGRVT